MRENGDWVTITVVFHKSALTTILEAKTLMEATDSCDQDPLVWGWVLEMACADFLAGLRGKFVNQLTIKNPRFPINL